MTRSRNSPRSGAESVPLRTAQAGDARAIPHRLAAGNRFMVLSGARPGVGSLGTYRPQATAPRLTRCPRSFKIFVMQAKYWRYKNGPLSVPAVTSTAEHSSGSLASSAAAC